MLDEEVIVKSAKHTNERWLIANIIIIVAMPAIFMGGYSDLISGLFITLGIIAPINVYLYKFLWVDAPKRNSLYYTMAISPYLIALFIMIVGYFSPSIKEVYVGSRQYLTLITNNPDLITSASTSFLTSLSSELISLACATAGLSIYFITNSRYIIRRILFFCSLIAVAMTIFGFGYLLVTKVLPNMPSFGHDAFSTFPNSTWWSAFALLWMGASLMTAVYSAQRFRLITFFYSLRFLALACGLALFASIMICATPITKIMALILLGYTSIVLTFDSFPTEKNLLRHWTSKYARVHIHKSPSLFIPTSIYAIVALISISIAATIASTSFANEKELLIVDSSNQNTISLNERRALLVDSVDMIEERPLFGWGTGSFSNIFSFYQGSDLGDTAWATPHSDLINKLIENGFVGFGLAIITPLFFFFKWLFRWDFSWSGTVLSLTLLEVLALSVIDAPFTSIAVLVSFWVLLMSLFRWDDAEIR